MKVDLPLRTVNPLNERECWQARARRAREHLQTTYYALRAAKAPHTLPCVVTLTRIAPRKLDAHDGLPASLKAAADGVALWLGVNDNDPRITWRYAQRRGAPNEYGAEVEIQAA